MFSIPSINVLLLIQTWIISVMNKKIVAFKNSRNVFLLGMLLWKSFSYPDVQTQRRGFHIIRNVRTQKWYRIVMISLKGNWIFKNGFVCFSFTFHVFFMCNLSSEQVHTDIQAQEYSRYSAIHNPSKINIVIVQLTCVLHHSFFLQASSFFPTFLLLPYLYKFLMYPDCITTCLYLYL